MQPSLESTSIEESRCRARHPYIHIATMCSLFAVRIVCSSIQSTQHSILFSQQQHVFDTSRYACHTTGMCPHANGARLACAYCARDGKTACVTPSVCATSTSIQICANSPPGSKFEVEEIWPRKLAISTTVRSNRTTRVFISDIQEASAAFAPCCVGCRTATENIHEINHLHQSERDMANNVRPFWRSAVQGRHYYTEIYVS